MNKYIAVAITVLGGIAAGLSQVPYTWAHITVAAVSAMNAALAGGAGIATVATQRATVKATTPPPNFWPDAGKGK